ncbi:MAG: hypothetical protein NUK62_08440 [Tenericutes bacterium]|nr:hypothetical protein [Mycoplasmatota bacterium]
MSKKEIKKECNAFFSEAIEKWNRLLEIIGIACSQSHNRSIYQEGDEILLWIQENYPHFSEYSNF